MVRPGSQGMTLAEVMIVIVIMAIVFGAAMMTSRAIRTSRPELEAASRVKGLFQRARALAMAEGTYVRIVRNGNELVMEAFLADSNRWVFRARDELDNLGTGCPSPPPGLTPVDTVVVNLTGALAPAGALVYCDPSGRHAAAVEITPGGAVRIWKNSGNGWRVSEHES